jgi:hypothetical protein
VTILIATHLHLESEQMPTLEKQVENRLRSSGGRMTSQRRLILQTLQTMSGHPTAEEIYTAARQLDPASTCLRFIAIYAGWKKMN